MTEGETSAGSVPCLAADAAARELSKLAGKEVVLDTRGPIVYLGTLVRASEHFYELSGADVHDLMDGRSSKELYILDARKFGLKRNRHCVYVRAAEVVSISLLEDVIVY